MNDDLRKHGFIAGDAAAAALDRALPVTHSRTEDTTMSDVPTNAPTKAGWYWALWISAAEGTGDVAECANGREWEVVEVWENFQGEACEADETHAPKFAVSVTGVSRSQWLENFKWGSEIASRLVIERMIGALKGASDFIAINSKGRELIGLEAAIRDQVSEVLHEVAPMPPSDVLNPNVG